METFMFNQNYVLFAGICIWVCVLTTGCSGNPASSNTTDSDAGTMALSIKWHRSRNSVAGLEQRNVKALSNCGSEGVATIQCLAYGETDMLLTEGPEWPCQVGGGGTIEQVSSGDNRSIVCLGRDDLGNIVHLGRTGGVTITSGQTTATVQIDSYAFTASLLTPEIEDVVAANDFYLTWSSVANAQEYLVEVDDSEQFDTPVISDQTTETRYMPRTLDPDQSYHWRITPVDQYGNLGTPYQTWQFNTQPGSRCYRPALSSIGSQTTAVGEELRIELDAIDTDVGQGVVYTANNLPDGADFDESTGSFFWIPVQGDEGNHLVAFSVCNICDDRNRLCSTEEVVIAVNDANGNPVDQCLPPVLDNIGPREALVGDPLVFTITAADPDPDAILTFNAEGLPRNAVFSPITRTFSWTPSATQMGSHTVLFRVSDNCAAGPLSDSENVVITVRSPPDTPDPQTPTELSAPALIDENAWDNGCTGDGGWYDDPILWDFEWSAVSNAERYQLSILMNGQEIISRVVDSTQYSYVCAENSNEIPDCVIENYNELWTWRVRAGAGENWSEWSETRSFNIYPSEVDCVDGPGYLYMITTGTEVTPASGAVLTPGSRVTINFNYFTSYYEGAYIEFIPYTNNGEGSDQPTPGFVGPENTFFPIAYEMGSGTSYFEIHEEATVDYIQVIFRSIGGEVISMDDIIRANYQFNENQ